MTEIISLIDYRKRSLPTVGYLGASSNRSDEECLNRAHLARVLCAREGWRDTSAPIDAPPLSPLDRFCADRSKAFWFVAAVIAIGSMTLGFLAAL